MSLGTMQEVLLARPLLKVKKMVKRVAEFQVTKDTYESAEYEVEETGEREQASEEILASRRIVKAKRVSPDIHERRSPMKPSSAENEVPSTSNDVHSNDENVPNKPVEVSEPVNPFSGLLFSSSSSCNTPTFGSMFTPSFTGGLFSGSFPGFSELASTPGSFGRLGENAGNDDEKNRHSDSEENQSAEEESATALLSNEPLCGEEDEDLVYSHDCKLFQLTKILLDDSEDAKKQEQDVSWKWTDRGIAIIRVLKNKKDSSKVRIVVRMKGVLKVLVNSPIIGKPEKVGEKSVKFIAVEETAKEKKTFHSFRVNLLSSEQQGKLFSVLEQKEED